ncbi:hypothetical protein Ocin01_12258 [Orchesella cincta]|uniref:Uncharacterized protein n=1 Tax=Orchesella cincta TaxID=48709 RepID=A0A1D2MN04_ORCCI|nr:hypothetical protein Ocin01_12258 [Orchesella cincta]
MQPSHLILLLAFAITLVLLLHVDGTESTYAYTVRGFVQDVRTQPLRFIGGLFFKKAFILKKLKLKWKLKKKFVLKKLLKKLFLSWKLAGLKLSTKSILPQIFAQYWGYKEPYYWGWGGWSQVPPSIYHHHHYPPLLAFKSHHGLSSKAASSSSMCVCLVNAYGWNLSSQVSSEQFSPRQNAKRPRLHELIGRKRRAIRFPEDNGSGSSGSSLGFNTNPGLTQHHQHEHEQQQSSGRMFFDEEFQSIGLGQQELDMLKQLPENLQYEYRQEMQDLDTSASEPKEEHIMEYLDVTNQFDTDHCIAKGICEVMAKGNRTDNRFENLLLDYYTNIFFIIICISLSISSSYAKIIDPMVSLGLSSIEASNHLCLFFVFSPIMSSEEPEARKDPNGSPAYIYDYAAFLGKSRGDSRACASYFPKCPESRQSLSTFMNEIFSSEMCDPPPVTNQLL